MNIAIRVDASEQIGTGHVMRCLTLAEEFRTKGARIIFVCRDFQGSLCTYIESKGFTLYRLPFSDINHQNEYANFILREPAPSHASWLGVPWQQDAQETISALMNEHINSLVVDHFAIDAKWEKKVKKSLSVKLMIIDGLGDRPHDCDLLLDQTFSRESSKRWEQLVPSTCKLFVGPQYALLRPEFYKLRWMRQEKDGLIRRILIAFGGVDKDNATGMILESIMGLNRKDIAIDIVIGGSNPNRALIEEKCKKLANVNLYVQPSDLAKIMMDADFAIGAAGTMMWERCCLGLPSLLVSIAENQLKVSENLDSIKAACFAGSVKDVDIQKKVMEKLSFFINNAEEVKAMAANSFQLMGDCEGGKRESIFNEMFQ